MFGEKQFSFWEHFIGQQCDLFFFFLKLWDQYGKDPDAGKDWGQEDRGTTEDELVGWHHRINGHEFEKTLEIVEDRGAWHAAVPGVAKSWTRLSN